MCVREPNSHQQQMTHHFDREPTTIGVERVLWHERGSALPIKMINYSMLFLPARTALQVVACPEGLRYLANRHPRVKVVTAAVDAGLNENMYIVPGERSSCCCSGKCIAKVQAWRRWCARGCGLEPQGSDA